VNPNLSKRSNVPGMHTGFVAGDIELIGAFLLYRACHGSATGLPVLAASIATWGDETHVAENRRHFAQ
jgi:N-succinyldiaminopimelate aminotransferase